MREKIYAGLASVTFLLGLGFLGLDGNFAASRNHWNFFLNGWAYATYVFFALALFFAVLTIQAWRIDHGSAAVGVAGRLRNVLDFLPTVNPPKRRVRLRRGSDRRRADQHVALGRHAERAEAAGLETAIEAIGPAQTRLTVRPRRSPELDELAKAAASQPPRSQAVERLVRAAAGGESGLSPSAATVARNECRTLRQQGEALHEELWVHANRAKVQLMGGALPKVYLGQAEDWHTRFEAIAKRHLSEQQHYRDTAPYPPLALMLTGLATAKLVDDLDTMFSKDVAVLRTIEARL